MARSRKSEDLDGMLAERRSRSVRVRDLTDGIGERKGRDAAFDEKPFSSPIGWLVNVIGVFALVLVIVFTAVAAPAVMDCRAQASQGFFAGDTFGECLSKGVSARMDRLDNGIKTVWLGSGR